MSAPLTVISEPAYASTLWYAETFAGLQEAAAQKGVELLCRALETGEPFPDELALASGEAAVLLGTSTGWIDSMAARLDGLGARVLTVGGNHRDRGRLVSSICLDYQAAMGDAVGYLHSHGRERVALLGINPASAVDSEKALGWRAGLERHGLEAPSSALYRNHGALEACVDSFLEDAAQYDSVICSNDLAALQLLQRLRDKGGYAPESLFLISFGDTLLGELTAPSLTTVTLNYRDVGRQALALWKCLRQAPADMVLSCRVGCRIRPRGTTLFLPVGEEDEPAADSLPAKERNLFFKDPFVQDVLMLEELFSRMDLTDGRILTGILHGMGYENLAEQLNISDGTVKYRLKRMLKAAGLKNKEALFYKIDRRVGLPVLDQLCRHSLGKAPSSD